MTDALGVLVILTAVKEDKDEIFLRFVSIWKKN